MEKSLIVILGAGPVGKAVAAIALERGHRVRFVTRSGNAVMAGTEILAADVRDVAALTAAAEGASVLVHAVGVPYQDWEREFPAMQTAVLSAAQATGAVAVFAENLYSYTADAMPLSESSSERPATKKGALRLALSRQWLDAHAAGKVRAVSVRASDYFGPGATRSPNSHFGARFFPSFEAGKPVAFLGNPEALHSFTYLPDYARALIDVATEPTAWGQVWLAPSLGPTSARAVAERFAHEAGRSVRVGRLPTVLVRLLGWFNPLIKEVVEMLYQFEKEFTVDASAFEKRFGWKATGLEQAVRETWASHRGQGSGR